MCGVNGLSAEVSKNIVLAGVKALTLLDSKEFDVEELGARFLIPQGEEDRKVCVCVCVCVCACVRVCMCT